MNTQTNTFITPSGFMNSYEVLGDRGFAPAPEVPLMARFEGAKLPATLQGDIDLLERGQFSGDIQKLLTEYMLQTKSIYRGVTSTMTNFPVRENLEAEAKLLIPVDTPWRNRLARSLGSGTASQWRTVTTTGGGWGTGTDQPGGTANYQVFFGENGAPAEITSQYGARTAAYKLLGQRGSVTGFAMASGANFQNQYYMERRHALMNVMLNEENALINGDSTSVVAPWGDGTTALAFDGIINRITVANGTPSAQVQAAVGALTYAHLDAQLTRLWNQGARGYFMLMNSQEARSIKNIAQGIGIANPGNYRIVLDKQGGSIVGMSVAGYIHPITQEVVDIVVSRFMPAGTIIFGANQLPDGSPAADVQVLPQVELPQLAPDESVQGYVAQEIAPSWNSPQVYGFIVSVFGVLRVKSQNHFAKSTGVTAV